jgi:hypothetical protein
MPNYQAAIDLLRDQAHALTTGDEDDRNEDLAAQYAGAALALIALQRPAPSWCQLCGPNFLGHCSHRGGR